VTASEAQARTAASSASSEPPRASSTISGVLSASARNRRSISPAPRASAGQ
jgi:hypothetical protein